MRAIPDRPVIDVTAFIDSRTIGRFQITVVALCAAVVLFDGLDTQVIGYLGPALARDWNLPRSALGPIFSVGLLGLMLGLLVMGPIADKTGRKFMIVSSVALFGSFTLLTAFAHGVTELLVYRLVAGIGLGGALPNALALTGEYCPARRRATLTVLMFCGFSLGSILGGGLAAGLISRFGWRSIFFIGGALPLLLIPLLMMKLPESLHFLVTRGSARRSNSGEIAKLLARIDPGYAATAGARFRTSEPGVTTVPMADLFRGGRGIGTALLWIVFFMNLLDFYFLQNWLPIVFTDSGLSVESAVLATTLISVGGIVAGIMSGPLMDRFGAYFVLAGLYVFGTVLVASIGLAGSSLPAVLLTTFGAGFCVSGAQKSMNALAVIFYPAATRSTGVGWALGVGRAGGILGAAMGSWLMARSWSTVNIFRFAAMAMSCAAVGVFVMGLRYGRKAQDTAP